MVFEPICCPACESTNVVKNGKSDEGKQRYRCRNQDCSRASFIRDYTYRAYLPEVKAQIKALNAANQNQAVGAQNHLLFQICFDA